MIFPLLLMFRYALEFDTHQNLAILKFKTIIIKLILLGLPEINFRGFTVLNFLNFNPYKLL